MCDGHLQEGLWLDVGYGEVSGHSSGEGRGMGRSLETSDKSEWRPRVKKSPVGRGKADGLPPPATFSMITHGEPALERARE